MHPKLKSFSLAVCLLAATPLLAAFTGTELYLPSVAALPGAPPSVWYTTVWVHNPNTTEAHVTFYLLERQTNLAPLTFADTVPPGDTQKYENAVQLMFNKQTAGAIRVTSDVKVVVGSRVYSQAGAVKDSVGQFFAGTPASFAIGNGQSTELLGVYGTQPSSDSSFRYNFGFVETTGSETCQVEVTAKDHDGTVLGTKSYPVHQWEQVQKGFKDEFAGLSTENARLTVKVTSGNGKVIAFGSSVANGSQDPATFEMSFRDDLLAENATGGALTGVTAGGGLTGGGTSGVVTLAVASAAITTSYLGDSAVTLDKLADSSVSKSKLAATGGISGQVLGLSAGALAWQADGLSLPFSKTASTSTGADLLYLKNSGTGRGLHVETSGDTALWAVASGSATGIDARSASGIGCSASSDTSIAISGTSNSHDGIQGYSKVNGRSGVYGANSAASGYGVFGRNTANGTWGYLGGPDAVHGETPSGEAVYGKNTTNTTTGYLGGTYAVFGQVDGNLKTAIYGSTSGNTSLAVSGVSTGTNGIGVAGSANSGSNAWAVFGTSTSGYAGWFAGKVNITGTLSKGGGSFKIDHPLDPEHEYLYHSFVESPDMMNIYNGNVTTDASGEAVVTLPDWFEALNRDFRYQLTVIGQFAQAIVATKISGNHFMIRTDKPGVEVSWMVTGIRHDRFAEAHRIPVEEIKPDEEQGTYLHPTEWGQPEERSVEHALRARAAEPSGSSK